MDLRSHGRPSAGITRSTWAGPISAITDFGIELVNNEYEAFVGRDLNREGAHTVGMNGRGIGICLVGNFDEADVPQVQWDRGIKLVRSYCQLLSIPIRNVQGHRDYASKSCPGNRFDMDRFRKELAG